MCNLKDPTSAICALDDALGLVEAQNSTEQVQCTFCLIIKLEIECLLFDQTER